MVPTEAPAETLPTEVAPVEVLPTETAPAEVLPTEAAPAEELPAEPAPVEGTSTEPSLAEVLDKAGFVLETFSGEPVSLVSQAVLDSVNNSDPYLWSGEIEILLYKFIGACTEGLGVTCFESVNPIQLAIDDIEAGTFIPTEGTLYFDAGSIYDVDSIVIDTVPGLKN